jgi:hypothetical protein
MRLLYLPFSTKTPTRSRVPKDKTIALVIPGYCHSLCSEARLARLANQKEVAEIIDFEDTSLVPGPWRDKDLDSKFKLQ